MSNWVEIRHNEGNFILDFEKVFELYIEHRHENTKQEAWYVVLVTNTASNNKSFIHCNSELEAQMIFAKLKKFLQNNGVVKEINL